MKSKTFSRNILLAAVVYVSIGCIITPRRSPVVTPTAVTTVGASYMRGFNLETNVDGHASLLTFDIRRAAWTGSDWGLGWTYDFTKYSDGKWSTIWGDFRWQLLNREGVSFRPMLDVGYGLGQIYNGSGRTVVSFPVSAGMKFRKMTGQLGCRIEYISRKLALIPGSSTAPRTLWTIGCEIPFQPNKKGYGRRFDVELGVVNSLLGGPGDNGILFNFVANYDIKD